MGTWTVLEACMLSHPREPLGSRPPASLRLSGARSCLRSNLRLPSWCQLCQVESNPGGDLPSPWTYSINRSTSLGATAASPHVRMLMFDSQVDCGGPLRPACCPC